MFGRTGWAGGGSLNWADLPTDPRQSGYWGGGGGNDEQHFIFLL